MFSAHFCGYQYRTSIHHKQEDLFSISMLLMSDTTIHHLKLNNAPVCSFKMSITN